MCYDGYDDVLRTVCDNMVADVLLNMPLGRKTSR